MYEDTERFIDLDFEQQVRQAAYHLWENDGRPFGKESHYWFQALEQLLALRSASPTEAGDSDQLDDNLDDLGRRHDGSVLDQPHSTNRP
jgi:hypothetical protein